MIATDQVRQVVRAFFSHEFLPSVHHSSFDVARALSLTPRDASGTVAGFMRRHTTSLPASTPWSSGRSPTARRWCVEGVHLLPDIPSAHLCERATTVRVMLAVRDEAEHREHFHTRGMQTLRAPERYLEALDRIRVVQDYLVERAEAAGVPVIDGSGSGRETMWRRVLEVVLDAVGDASGAEPSLISSVPSATCEGNGA